MDKTRVTLLNRLKNGEDLDWNEFYAMYDHAILAYARKLGLDQDAAYDVLQESMVNLVRILKTFEYDREKGLFRNFLLTIVHRNCLKAFRRNRKESELHAELPVEDYTQEPDKEQQQMWQAALVDQAISNIRKDPATQPQTLDIFSDYAIKGMSPSAVAKKYNVQENNIYQIKLRMIERLKREVDQLANGVEFGWTHH